MRHVCGSGSRNSTGGGSGSRRHSESDSGGVSGSGGGSGSGSGSSGGSVSGSGSDGDGDKQTPDANFHFFNNCLCNRAPPMAVFLFFFFVSFLCASLTGCCRSIGNVVVMRDAMCGVAVRRTALGSNIIKMMAMRNASCCALFWRTVFCT